MATKHFTTLGRRRSDWRKTRRKLMFLRVGGGKQKVAKGRGRGSWSALTLLIITWQKPVEHPIPVDVEYLWTCLYVASIPTSILSTIVTPNLPLHSASRHRIQPNFVCTLTHSPIQPESVDAIWRCRQPRALQECDTIHQGFDVCVCMCGCWRFRGDKLSASPSIPWR